MALSYTTKLTRKGQTTIPVEFRDQLGLKEGDQIIWTAVEGGIRMTSAREVVRRTAGIFRDRIPPLPPGGMDRRMAEEDEAVAQAIAEDWEQFQAHSQE